MTPFLPVPPELTVLQQRVMLQQPPLPMSYSAVTTATGAAYTTDIGAVNTLIAADRGAVCSIRAAGREAACHGAADRGKVYCGVVYSAGR